MPIVKLVDRSGSLRFQFSNGLAGAVPGSRPIIGTVPAAGSQLEGTSPPPFLDPRKPPTTSAHFERHWQGGRTWTSKEPGSKRLPSRTGLPRPLHTQQVSETIEGGSPTPYHTKGATSARAAFCWSPVKNCAPPSRGELSDVTLIRSQ